METFNAVFRRIFRVWFIRRFGVSFRKACTPCSIAASLKAPHEDVKVQVLLACIQFSKFCCYRLWFSYLYATKIVNTIYLEFEPQNSFISQKFFCLHMLTVNIRCMSHSLDGSWWSHCFRISQIWQNNRDPYFILTNCYKIQIYFSAVNPIHKSL